MTRDKQMAAIKASLEQAPHTKNPVDIEDTPTLPIVEDEKKQVKEKKETEKSAREQLKEQEQTRLQAARITEQSEKEGQAQSSRIAEAALSISQNVANLWKGTQVQLENIPTPGSLLLPFIILMVFFFLLLPVNGHTRFVWLWLVLTGQAEIGGSTSGAGIAEPLPPTSESGAEQAENFVLPNLGIFGTYASEVT
jgi:hypothetical protein